MTPPQAIMLRKIIAIAALALMPVLGACGDLYDLTGPEPTGCDSFMTVCSRFLG